MMIARHFLVAVVTLTSIAHAAGSPPEPQLSFFQQIVPSPMLPPEVVAGRSNNNVSIAFFENRLWVAFRTGPTHFASKKTTLYVMSSADRNQWRHEYTLKNGTDAREPALVVIGDVLHFYYFLGGTNPLGFHPTRMLHTFRKSDATWAAPEEVLRESEVPWQFQETNWGAVLTSYSGPHYRLGGKSGVSVHLQFTNDGTTFTSADTERETVYFGGVSEVGFAFTQNGDLWAVGRNEDGDELGFGSVLFHAESGSLGEWKVEGTDRECYMSPKLFRHEDELYLIARKNLGRHPFGRAPRALSWFGQRLINWISYSTGPKTTALYRINRDSKRIEWVMDLPGAGDTAFPSILQTSEHEFLFANYTSPLHAKRRSWIRGQIGRTSIYLGGLTFPAIQPASDLQTPKVQP